MLRHSVSFKANKKFNPNELLFLMRKWLLNNSRNSKFSKEDFETIYNNKDFKIENENESLKFLTYYENGLSFCGSDYKIEINKTIYLTTIQVLKNYEGTYIHGQLFTYSENKKIVPSASIPNIFELLLSKSKGGTNGSYPISINPVMSNYNSINLSRKDIKKPLYMPIVYIINQRLLNTKNISRRLFLEATVIISEDNNESLESITQPFNEGIIQKLSSIFNRGKISKQINTIAEILLPNGEREVIKCNQNGNPENILYNRIMELQSKHYTPIDYRLIFWKKEYSNKINYKSPNSYSRTVFEILVSLSSCERSILEDNLPPLSEPTRNKQFLFQVNKIILFRSDKELIKRLDYNELKKMIEIIKIFKENEMKYKCSVV